MNDEENYYLLPPERVLKGHTVDGMFCPVCGKELGELHVIEDHVRYWERMEACHAVTRQGPGAPRLTS